jgi:hypothetical protein
VAGFAAGEDQGGGEAFDAPFEGAGDGFVEVVEVENELTERCPVIGVNARVFAPESLLATSAQYKRFAPKSGIPPEPTTADQSAR